METSVLKSELAGSWYVDDPVHLARELETYLETVNPDPVEHLIGLMLPHAGYRYSGMVAAHGYKLLQGRNFKRVIVIGPSHRVALLDRVSLPDVTDIETPLGRIPLDREAIDGLLQYELFESHPRAHRLEHSVQIQLPFLQHVLDTFTLIPIVCGHLTQQSARRIGRALLPLMDRETLLVISTDFTHYGAAFDYVPFTDDIQNNLRRLDLGAFDLIRDKNAEGFLDYLDRTGATICGASPISVMLSMLDDLSEVRLLKYDTSGNMTDDWSHCVSYASAAISGRWKTAAADAEDAADPMALTAHDKAGLLRLARYRIASRFSQRTAAPSDSFSAAVHAVRGAFVTLHKRGQLRGCIGEIFPRRPLIKAVEEHAVNAAFQDPRFPALREDELAGIDIEISALSPPRKIGSYDEIEIGRHGIVISKQMQSAVFLPQVAPEQGWDLETTLGHLCMKAGLPSSAWKSDCEFHVFEADVFGEAD